MKKLALLVLAMGVTTGAFAEINGTSWRTIDDETGKPKAVIQFTKAANGTYTGTIIKTLDPAVQNGCMTCAGSLKGKKLEGVTVVRGLQSVGGGKYEGGTILDPKSGKTYKLNVTENGSQLKVRGYIGFSLIGRDQTWVRN
ncbi:MULTISPECIES: DUF2147 domain-containing protein [unclassified Acinetobacter]|uniref:DUF2147 domain-containing protein n=1 Tax=unclassified Acinetobacter TaxID=196816 RepID=UPI0035BA8CBC